MHLNAQPRKCCGAVEPKKRGDANKVHVHEPALAQHVDPKPQRDNSTDVRPAPQREAQLGHGEDEEARSNALKLIIDDDRSSSLPADVAHGQDTRAESE